MKKIVFALEIMSLMLVLPVYMVVELNHPMTITEKAVYVQKVSPDEKENIQDQADEINSVLDRSDIFTGVK